MNECKPHIMTAVPRFYQNLYQKINLSFSKATGLKPGIAEVFFNEQRKYPSTTPDKES